MKKIISSAYCLLILVYAKSQNIGVGTPFPFAKLHVYNGASGAFPFAFSPLVVESNTHTYINILSPAANEGAILFGQPASSANGVIMYNNTSTPNGFQFRNNGNLTRMVINNNGSVGIGVLNPSASALLEISSTTKGFLPPRMTRQQILDIVNPAEGLLIYNTTTKKPVYFNGTYWEHFDGSHIYQVGDNYQGGVIAYILQLGDDDYVIGQFHGFIITTSDFGTADWGCSGTDVPGASGFNIGTGMQNTIDIMEGCATAGIAARICGDLVLNGYSDWCLPSRNEFLRIYFNRSAIGNFVNGIYWTSSELNANDAIALSFVTGNPVTSFKTSAYYVRPIRFF